VDCPPVARRPSVWCVFFACSSSSSELALRSFEVPKFCGRRFGGPSAQRSRTARTAQVALGQSASSVRTVRILACSSGGSVAFNVLSTQGSWIVRPVSADRPPQPRGPSVSCRAELLSPLLLEFRFHFVIIWGLFLELVDLL
jgi:hypothetical protein